MDSRLALQYGQDILISGILRRISVFFMASPKKAKIKFQASKGMRDLLPKDQVYWSKVKEAIERIASDYGFRRLDTPLLEAEELFIKGTGSSTDIVEKEMYSLKTKGGERLVLRPEFTPSVIRAYLENGLSSQTHPVKLYGIGPIFRYERSQKGRYRQAHQANLEAIGEKDPILDAQLIQLFFAISKSLGLKKLITQINSIGCPKCRPNYRRALVNFYRYKQKDICPDCYRRLKQNPMRLLDCKEENCMEIAQKAPQVIEYLCDECCSHFKSLLEYLDELEIPYLLNHALVRGLDYYTKTVFEIWPEEEEKTRQFALAGGGRYDGLVELLGGKETPAVGFAIGLDRFINLLKEKEIKLSAREKPLVYVVQLGELAKKKSLNLFEEIRKSGLRIEGSFGKNSLKAQLRTADKKNARLALILGQKEALDDTVILRDMVSGSQKVISFKKVVGEIKKKLKNK